MKNRLKPLISIIIPCFNCAKTLEEAVVSCFKQGFSSSDLEIVMVDDGSTDNTKEIMNRLAAKHPEIRTIFHKRNMGGGVTRNTAVKNSRAEVIFCLDSDDILPEGTLLKMQSLMDEKKCDGVGIHNSIKFNNTDTSDIHHIDTFSYAGHKIPFESLLQKDGVLCPLYSTFMHTRSSFEKAGGYPTDHGFDTQGFAWRFLAAGCVAYGCPEASYLHRVGFSKSYYLREADAGRTNYNWQKIFLEHAPLFSDDALNFIESYNCKDFSKDIFADLLKQDIILKGEYLSLLGSESRIHFLPKNKLIYIRRDSILGLYIRIRERLKKNSLIRPTGIWLYGFINRIKNLITEGNEYKRYYRQIEDIKRNKKIVFDLLFGGIGDCLIISTLPRLLKEKYNIDFYLSEKSMERIRHPDIFKLCFELNPFFKGLDMSSETFRMKSFARERSLYSFITDKEGETLLEMLERQFGVKGSGRPEIHYEPHLLKQYEAIILVDNNMITGKKFGRIYEKDAFTKEALKYTNNNDKIEYVNPLKQDLFTYVDMIYSCKRFVGTFSGGASIAACFNKPISLIWPIEGRNHSLYQFRYKILNEF